MKIRAYLPVEEQRVFYRLFYAAGTYVNTKRNVVPSVKKMSVKYCSSDDAWEIVKVLRQHPEDMKTMAQERTIDLKDEERDIIAEWSRFLFGSFVVVDYTPTGSIFISEDGQNVYHVYGLRRPLEYFLGLEIPLRVKTCLLPFLDKIITDGFFERCDEMSEDEKVRFMEIYEKAKENGGIKRTI